MRSENLCLLLTCISGCSGSGDDQNPSQPNIVFPSLVVVTEGSSTTFQLSLEAMPTSHVKGFLTAVDQSLATIAPIEFDMSPENYPATMMLYGIKDMSPNPAGHRVTMFNGRLATDDAASSGGTLVVVDTDSLAVTASDWNVMMTPSNTASFNVQLTQAPSASTTVTIVPGSNATDATLVSVSPTTLTFGPTTYDIAQMVTVTSSAKVGRTQIDLRPAGGISPQTVVVNVIQ